MKVDSSSNVYFLIVCINQSVLGVVYMFSVFWFATRDFISCLMEIFLKQSKTRKVFKEALFCKAKVLSHLKWVATSSLLNKTIKYVCMQKNKSLL